MSDLPCESLAARREGLHCADDSAALALLRTRDIALCAHPLTAAAGFVPRSAGAAPAQNLSLRPRDALRVLWRDGQFRWSVFRPALQHRFRRSPYGRLAACRFAAP